MRGDRGFPVDELKPSAEACGELLELAVGRVVADATDRRAHDRRPDRAASAADALTDGRVQRGDRAWVVVGEKAERVDGARGDVGRVEDLHAFGERPADPRA